MTYIARHWQIHTGVPHPFNDPAPVIDNGTKRPEPNRYFDPRYKDAEWDRLWTKTWLLACPSSDIREDGDFAKFDIGIESFIIVRQEDGSVKAHLNVCPHRGSQIVMSDLGSQERFTCPFHNWQFGLDGTNQKVTDRETFHPDVLCHDINLTSVRCEEVAGLDLFRRYLVKQKLVEPSTGFDFYAR